MKKYILVLVCLSLSVGLRAQHNELLHRYRGMALDYNHDLKSAEKSIRMSVELEQSARADRNPKISGGASFNYTGFPMELSLDMASLGGPVSFKANNMQYGASLSVLQPVYTGGRILESIRIAQHQKGLAGFSSEAVRQAICYQTDMQYWSTVARREIVGITTQFRGSIASLVAIIKERVDVGLVDPQDLLMAEVKLNEADYQLLEAKSSFETGRMALNSLIGIQLGEATAVDTMVSRLELDSQLLSYEGNNRPEVQMAQERIKIAESSLKLNDSRFKPQFYVGADGSYSSPGHNFKADLDPNYALYAKLSVPIFEWGKRRSEKRAYTEKIGIENDLLGKVEDQVDLEIQTARVSLEQAQQRVRLSESSLVKAAENERQALERYNEGKVSVVEVIDAQIYRQSSQINFVQAKVSAQSYYSELIKALALYEK